MKIVVLGAGLVGGPIAMDLAADNLFEVAVADINPAALERIPQSFPGQKFRIDLTENSRLQDLIKPYDLVVSAVPGFMGYATLRSVIEAGKHVVDIAFFPENMFDLDELAKINDVIAISDMGVAPGMSNVLIGYADYQLDETEKAVIYVGGLPKVREWPYEYKAVFSPIDVIEEYTRPARFVENGKLIVKPALSDPELINFEGIGTLEAFNSDGLRSLACTIRANYMIEKTLRYPGHISIMRILRESGFFSSQEIEIDGKRIKPIDVTSRLLFPKWKLKDGEEDFTVMRVIVEGKKNGMNLRYEYNLLDSYHQASRIHSMARTTGYTATMAVRMIAAGLYQTRGVSAPEFIGKCPACVNFLLEGLKRRGVIYVEKITQINP